MKKMEYQTIINGLSITAMCFMICAIFCYVGIGIATHKRDKKFTEEVIELNKKILYNENRQKKRIAVIAVKIKDRIKHEKD